jgi:hypothetical protein
MRARCFLFSLQFLASGCYVGVRAGPSVHTGVSQSGPELAVTTGIELNLSEDLTNPLAGRASVAVGGGMLASSAGEMRENGSAAAVPVANLIRAPLKTGQGMSLVGVSFGGGLLEAEGHLTVARWLVDGPDDVPSAGALVRLTGTLGLGTGEEQTWDGTVVDHTDVDLWTAALGAEVGVHFGGGEWDSGGVFLGAGMSRSTFASTGGETTSTAPYVSLRVEGGIVLQTLLALLQSVPARCH